MDFGQLDQVVLYCQVLVRRSGEVGPVVETITESICY